MTPDSPDRLRSALESAIRDAERLGRGLTPEVESRARAHARAQRVAGVPVERVIIDVKQIVRGTAPAHELVFLPRVVGWTVAGYYAGTASSEPDPAATD